MRPFVTKLEKLLGTAHPEDELEFVPMMLVLKNGDILVSAVGEIDEKNLCLMFPYKLMYTGDKGSNIMLTIVKFVPGSDEPFFHLDADSVATMGFLNASLSELYDNAVESQIAEFESLANDVAELKDDQDSKVLQFPHKPKNPKTLH